MRILHLSHTPLVGAPGRICRALNALPGVDARWVVLDSNNYGGLSFDLDWLWERDRESVLAFAKSADVLHLHNYVDLSCRDFLPLDFSELWSRGQPMLRHFHSTPELVARYMEIPETEVLACPIPKLVIAQYPERFFPSAVMVPNLVDFPDELPVRPPGSPLRVGYAPSIYRSARASRWDTKGYPETVRQLRQIEKTLKRAGVPIEIDVITQVPHRECMARKAACDVCIDELVTGSYHLNTLESLALGKATLSFLDDRVLAMLFELTGRSDFPAINVRLENLEPILVRLAKDPEVARSLGAESRRWMQAHWDPLQMAKRFVAVYQRVCNDRRVFPARFDASPLTSFLVRERFDLQWQSRHDAWPKLPPQWFLGVRSRLGHLLRYAGFLRN